MQKLLKGKGGDTGGVRGGVTGGVTGGVCYKESFVYGRSALLTGGLEVFCKNSCLISEKLCQNGDQSLARPISITQVAYLSPSSSLLTAIK